MALQRRLTYLATASSLTLAVSLPFLVPFGSGRNADLQGYVLLLAGLFAWLALCLKERPVLHPAAQWLLVLFFAGGLVSLASNSHVDYGLFGAPYIRIGLLSFVSFLSISLLIAQIKIATKLQFLYGWICAIAVVSIPYSLIRFGSVGRIGGAFSQADVFACLLGIGLLVGLHLFRQRLIHRPALITSQVLLASLLLLTETRAVIGLVALLVLIWLVREQNISPSKLALPLIAVAFLFLTLQGSLPARLTDRSYAAESLHYRLELKREGLEASFEKPFFGYGPGNLADALDCRQLESEALQKTCGEKRFFNSSHNIFLDRIIAFGWPAGLGFLALAVLAIRKSWLAKHETRILSYVLLLITGYYLTNVTHIVIELLLWAFVVSCLLQKPNVPSAPARHRG